MVIIRLDFVGIVIEQQKVIGSLAMGGPDSTMDNSEPIWDEIVMWV